MRHRSLEFYGDIWTGGINVGIIRVYMIFKGFIYLFIYLADRESMQEHKQVKPQREREEQRA